MRLETLRARDGLSQEQVARQLGVSRNTMKNWEDGVTEPNASQIKALADMFGVTTDYLLDRKENEDQ